MPGDSCLRGFLNSRGDTNSTNQIAIHILNNDGGTAIGIVVETERSGVCHGFAGTKPTNSPVGIEIYCIAW
jgi:hypothetical protein